MKIVRLVCCFVLLLTGLLAIWAPGIALAQDEEEVVRKIELAPNYPSLEAIAGGVFEFEVEFRYTGGDLQEVRDFTLKVTAPKGWEVYLTPPFEKEKKVTAIRLSPGYAFGNKLRLYAQAPFWPLPDPGEYKIILEAISDDEDQIKDSTELKAVITATYVLMTTPTNERYNTTVRAGKDNFFSLNVQSLSTAAIENITFTTNKPEGWLIKFTPDKIEKQDALSTQTVDVNIKPPPKTIAGDYVIGIRASGAQATANEIQIRVTVESPTIWGWVGVAIIVLVIAGLVVIFMRFSRR